MLFLGTFVSYLIYRHGRKKMGEKTSIFIAAFAGDLLTYVFTSVQLALAVVEGLITVIVIGLLPLLTINSEFAGIDSLAGELIEEIAPNYIPWFSSIFEPSGPEVESFLFTLQASFGAIVVGYIFGYFKGKRDAGNMA